MTFARTATAGFTDNASATTVEASAYASVSGRLISGYVAWEGGNTTLSVADTAGDTYVVGTPIPHGAAPDQVIAPFYCLSSLGHASNVVTATFGAARSTRVIQAAEYSSASSAAFDGYAYGESAPGVNSVTSAGIATTGSSGVLFAGVKTYQSTTITAGGSLSLIAQQGNFGADAQRILSSAGTYTGSFATSSNTTLSTIALAFKEGAAGPTVTTITGTTATEGSAVVFTVTMSGTGGLTDAYSWSGTAGSGDYTQTLTDGMFTTTGGSGSVTVSGGNIVVPSAVTEFTVTVPTTGDTLDEANETIRLVFGGVTSSSGTINDDDAPPTITGTTSSTVTAGSPVVITYSPGLSGQTRTYTLALTDGTATGGTDYDNTTVTGDFAVTAGTGSVSISGSTVTVDPGVTEFTLSITTTP